MSSKDKDDFIIALFKHPISKKIIQEQVGGIDLNAYYEQAITTINKNIFGRNGEVLKKGEAKKAINAYFKSTKDYQ
jgi:hypothetical protein